MSGSSVQRSSTTDALTLIPLPDPVGLANTQLRGRSCTWCAITLTATAINLGERPLPDGTSWFPRGCRPCTKYRINEALAAHRAFCQACTEVDDPCDVRDALRAIASGADQ